MGCSCVTTQWFAEIFRGFTNKKAQNAVIGIWDGSEWQACRGIGIWDGEEGCASVIGWWTPLIEWPGLRRDQ